MKKLQQEMKEAGSCWTWNRGPVPNGTLNPRGLPLSPHFRDVMPLWLSGRSLLRACTSAGSAEVRIEGA